ncbi:MAG: hypothetical protein J0L53_18815 [Spirochaetes bacterium]|nr:hypothetical protein [Spirochaetota bacterium]
MKKPKKQISGNILEIKTRNRKGHKWLDVMIDIDAKGETEYLFKAEVGSVRRYAEERGLAIKELIGTAITIEV